MIKICSAKTSKNLPCKRKIKSGFYCFSHKFLSHECPICYNTSKSLSFKCSHIVCLECLKQIEKLECPLCRKDIKEEIPNKILEIRKELEEKKRIENRIEFERNLIELGISLEEIIFNRQIN